MGLAHFTVVDPNRPAATQQEVEDLIAQMDGVLDWKILPNGDVMIDYDQRLITDPVIENALRGIGFRLHHISDRPAMGDSQAREVMGR
jgi:predicted TIM-barrel fold metal-dependent hydrolase